MSAGRYSFTIEQGATTSFEVQYKNSSNVPFNLAGCSGRMQLRPSIDSSTVLLTLSSSLEPDGTGLNFSGSNGATSQVSGAIGIYVSAATSSLLSFDNAVYDLELVSGSVVTRLLEGTIKLSKEVTR